jgi:hypothetical protein
MANAVYPTYKVACLTGNAPNLASVDVKAVLVDTNGGTPYTYSAAHEFLTDVPAGSRLSTTAALGSKTTTGGVFGAGNIALPDAGGGATGEALILFVDTTDAATSRLIAYIDTASGLPITLDGVADTIQWNASGIFAL